MSVQRLGSEHIEPEDAQAGDWIEVDSTRGGSPRHGEVREVIGEGHHLHLRVGWEDGRESLFYPAHSAAQGVIVHRACARERLTQ
ncbi:MAG TPA: DUF1918 domain-containing protein [Solirubrobacteraceae bacterium]|nr:DUF1918 domain-containing protein [Solirubrobacteraceae bacterium]HUA74079.1 DUF1918 domain-containing protein [Solirubrobacteraceae bacterium]